MRLRWRPTLTTRPVLCQALSHGVSIYVWCRSATGWTVLSQSNLLFVVAKSQQLIFRPTASTAGCGPLSCIHIYPMICTVLYHSGCVSLLTYWGVLMQWGGAYLGFTVGSTSLCPVQHVSWITLSLSSRLLPASEKAMVRPLNKSVLSWSLFGKLFCACPVLPTPPQLHDAGDWVQPGHKSVAYEALYPTRNFPTAGTWMVQLPESLVVPPTLPLHLWHYLPSTIIYVPQRRIAQPGDGEMVYWFHLGAHLPEQARWPTF